jgi:signal peptidase I
MQPTKSQRFLTQAWDLARFVLTVLLIVIPIRVFIAKPFIVSGASMDPTFADKEYLIIDELSYYLRAPERGEVAIFKFPKDPSKYFIKRVIGLPGETVIIKNNQVSIKKADGTIKKVNESYLKNSFETQDEETTLGASEYFMMGDNRAVSYDSRAWGAVPEDLIAGRAFVRLFPPNRIGLLPGAITAKP